MNQLELDLFPKLWGQKTPFACLIDKEKDFEEELKLFAQCAPFQPAIEGLFSRIK
jgi:hypothetical protein